MVWQGGYFGGHYTGCGWTKKIWLASSGGSGDTSCASPDREFATYAVLHNTNINTDGALVDNSAACNEYANARPWSTSAAPVDFLRQIPAHATYAGDKRLKWRYTTRYGSLVMVRDRAVADGQGNWVFVPRSCLPGTLPFQG